MHIYVGIPLRGRGEAIRRLIPKVLLQQQVASMEMYRLLSAAVAAAALLQSCQALKVSDRSVPVEEHRVERLALRNSRARTRPDEANRTRTRPEHLERPTRASRKDGLAQNHTRGATQTPVQHSEATGHLETATVHAVPKQVSGNVNALLTDAKSYLGTPYAWGGTTKSGMDCSGFVQTAYKSIGVELPRIAGDQYRAGTPVQRNALQPGDLVFFKSPRSSGIAHTGIVFAVNGDDVQFIHSASSVGVTFSKLNDYYWRDYYAGACRILK